MKVIAKIPPILLYTVISLSSFTETIYSSSLPEIASYMRADGGSAQMATSAYFFGFAIGILTLGRISDIYGRRPIMLFGLSVYVIISFLIGFCENIESFIILRFFQAYGASVGSVIAQSMARDSYKGWELSYIYVNVSIVMAIVPTAGAYIGGNIVEYFSWQADFYFLTGLAILIIIIFIKFLPETNPYIGQSSLRNFWSLFKVMMKDKKILSHAFIVGSYNGICFGFYIQAPFIFIDRLDTLPSDYVTLFLLLAVANLIGGLVSRYMIKKYVLNSTRITIGFILSSLGFTLMLVSANLFSEDTNIGLNIITVFGSMMIHLVGHCIIVPTLLPQALEDYTKTNGAAGSIFGFSYYMITGVISFLISYFHSNYINNFALLGSVLLILCIIVYHRYFNQKSSRNEIG